MDVIHVYGSYTYIINDMIKRDDICSIARIREECLQDAMIIAEAAYHGKIAIMRILIAKRCAIDSWVCHYAMRSKHKNKVVRFLVKTGIWHKYYKPAKMFRKKDFHITYDSEEDN